MEGKDGKHDPATTEAPLAGAPQPAAPPAESARWGTRQMGPPAAPGAHPENQEAARWTAARGDQELPPYVIMGEPVAAPPQQKGKGDSPMEHILDFFNTWSRKAEELASNIWFNRKFSQNPCFGSSVWLEQRMLCFAHRLITVDRALLLWTEEVLLLLKSLFLCCLILYIFLNLLTLMILRTKIESFDYSYKPIIWMV